MPGGPKVDEDAGASGDLVANYETLRAVAITEGAVRAGLGAALIVTKGLAAWVRGWRALAPVPHSVRAPAAAPPGELVDVLAAMAFACA